jgi:threonine dehydratase
MNKFSEANTAAQAPQSLSVSLEDIRKAREVLRGVIKTTELARSESASKLMGHDVYFKFENTQHTGSFKLRGAYNKIFNLTAQEKERGVVASSAGNHAQGVAYSATRLGVRSKIVMPIQAPLVKVAATRDYGAEVIFYGEVVDDSHVHAHELEEKEGLVFVHPYQDPLVIAGQGTLGLEVIEALPDLETIIVPIGGGGLISGIATAVKAINPNCRVIGVQSQQAPGMEKLFHHQSVAEPPRRISTIADGIAIKKPSQLMYDCFISRLVDEVVTVTDDEIAEAIVFCLEKSKSVLEGAGAAGLAALLSRKLKLGKKTCVVLCGGNIDLNIISKVIEKGQIRKGRLVELSVVVDDLPGSLSRLTQAIASESANVMEVHHDRVSQGLYLRETKIDFVLETTSPEHVLKIREALIRVGAKIL